VIAPLFAFSNGNPLDPSSADVACSSVSYVSIWQKRSEDELIDAKSDAGAAETDRRRRRGRGRNRYDPRAPSFWREEKGAFGSRISGIRKDARASSSVPRQ